DICKARYEAFGSAGNGSKLAASGVQSLETITARYASGELDQKIS
ncbi:MAG TPA: fructose-1,6-bisphosphate aldolase, partial [Desulfobacterales bacterium]|nr:fructose-1,6-bisphosphate aldolase [Desulfobacterales bacterium]